MMYVWAIHGPAGFLRTCLTRHRRKPVDDRAYFDGRAEAESVLARLNELGPVKGFDPWRCAPLPFTGDFVP